MSRSYHETRSRRRVEQQLDLIDPAELGRKRAVKAMVRMDRVHRTSMDFEPVPPDAIPIVVKESGEHLCYPASLTDLRAVMGALPPGSLTGLASIELSSGRLASEDLAPFPNEVRDPYFGRRGTLLCPGVFEPLLRGTYVVEDNRIQLFACVVDPEALIGGREQWILRYDMLETLVHEIAHHFDYTSRTHGYRQATHTDEKAEAFADALTTEWCESYVVPYLKAQIRRERNR